MPILSVILWMPIAGLAMLLLAPKERTRLIRAIALLTSGASFLLSWRLIFAFDSTTAALQFTERKPWIPELGMTYTLGIDGVSFPMVLLTTLMTLVAVIASCSLTDRLKGYFAWFMLLEFSMLGVFMAQDWFLFYVFWEIGLVPMFFLIGLWGGQRRSLATMSFFLYTLAGSIALLLGIIAMYLSTDLRTFDMQVLVNQRDGWDRAFQIGPFLAFFVGFAVKVPAFPLHGWLPLAHVEAPSPVSIVLSAIMLKMGAYGLIRLANLFPLAMEWFAPVLLVLGLVNIIYGALLAFRQTDLKALVAFSSISHMGFVLLGLAAMNATGFSGAVLQMVTHGIITGTLFLLVGWLYDRAHTRETTDFGGLARRVPIYSAFFSLALFASLGMPGLAQFVSEFLVLVGAFQRWGLPMVIATVGILITAAYSLRTIGQMLMGPLNTRWADLPDLGRREMAAAIPLAVLIIAIGLYPQPVLSISRVTVEHLTQVFK